MSSHDEIIKSIEKNTAVNIICTGVSIILGGILIYVLDKNLSGIKWSIYSTTYENYKL